MDDTSRRLQQIEQRYRTLFTAMDEGFALHEIKALETGLPS